MGKIIFLDIDGVLNCLDDYSRARHRSDIINPLFKRRLKRVIKETKAQIVVSSMWRFKGAEVLDKYLGLKILGTTGCREDGIRGLEILDWLEQARINSQAPDHWIVIDDEEYDIKDHIPAEQFVKTSFEEGFTCAAKVEAIRKLNKQ